MTHTETSTKTTRDGTRITVTSTASYNRTVGGEVLTDVAILGPDGKSVSTVENTIRFTRSDGLDDNYQPARWVVTGRANHLKTVAEVVEYVANQHADRIRLILDHPEAFPNQAREYRA